MEQLEDVTVNQQERLEKVAWLAGLWEGEGCFSLFRGGKNRIYAASSIVNTDMRLIEAIHQALDSLQIGHYINARKYSEKNPKHKDCKVIYICGFLRVKKLLQALRPFIKGNKSEVVDVILQYIERRLLLPKNTGYSSLDFAYIKQVRALNQKGPSGILRDYTLTPEISGEDIVQTA